MIFYIRYISLLFFKAWLCGILAEQINTWLSIFGLADYDKYFWFSRMRVSFVSGHIDKKPCPFLEMVYDNVW